MKVKNILIFLMAFALLIQQPAGVMAAEPSPEPSGGEQAETEPADGQEETESANGQTGTESTDGQEEKKETDNITDDAEPVPGVSENQPDNPLPDSNNEAEQEKTDGDPSSGQSEENDPAEDEKKQETEATEGKTETTETGTEKTEPEETEIPAEEIAVVPEDEDAESETESEESRIVLELPMLENYGFSPFDFIMDPQGLITTTNAAKYGGARFEEGATLYFKNTNGDYEYSHTSDWLSIISRSNVPVCVTVELTVEETYGVNMTQDKSFLDDGSCSMYLALLDNDGNERAVNGEGKAVLEMVLPACENEEDAAECSFALTGCCNPEGDWFVMAECPRIVVNWMVEPIIPEEEENVH